MSHLLRNPAKEKLAIGELVLCLSIRQLRTVDCAMIVQACGFDVIVIDREHAPISTELTSAICVAALGLGLTPLVRVAALTAHEIGLALDGGALGVIVPQVNTRATPKRPSGFANTRRSAGGQSRPSAPPCATSRPPSRS